MPTISLPATIQNLEKISRFVTDAAEKYGFEDQKIQELELATEEAVVNIINYAYPEETGMVEICFARDDSDRIILEIMDTGIPFNPLQQSKPDLSSGISERKVGGLGIFFIRSMMEDVKYRHEDGKNILTLIPHQT